MSLLGIDPKGTKTYVHTKSCKGMFIIAVFIWKQSRCPPTGEWVSKPCPIHVREYHATVQRQESQIHRSNWTDCKCMMPTTGKTSIQKATCWMIPLIRQPGKGKITGTEAYQWLPGAGRERRTDYKEK